MKIRIYDMATNEAAHRTCSLNQGRNSRQGRAGELFAYSLSGYFSKCSAPLFSRRIPALVAPINTQ